MRSLKNKLPTRQGLFTVYSTAVFITFSWTIYRMLFQVPSWVFYMSLADMLWILAYVLGFALLESGFLLVFLILLALIFPKKVVGDKFVAQSTLVLAVLTTGALLYQQNIGMLKWWGLLELAIFIPVFIASLTLLIYIFSTLFDRLPAFKNLLDSLAERLTVFAFIYLPPGALGLAVVIARNIFR